MGIENFLPCDDKKINELLLFTAEVDKMTAVMRRTLLIDGFRHENAAEHSWHIALMSMLFKDFALEGTDIGRSVKMCVVHDLIEIYAGDTFAYDVVANNDKNIREIAAADKLFSMLPGDMGKELRALWEEFDLMESADAKYAACMDRIQPFLHNTLTEGHTWQEGRPSVAQVYKRIGIVKDVILQMWQWVEKNIERAIENDWLEK